MIIDKFLYNGLAFNITLGYKPLLVNGTIVKAKVSVPKVDWSIDFGRVTLPFKNAIESMVVTEPDNTYIKSYVGPSYLIGKFIAPITGDVQYYISYIFEYDYYSTFVNKPLAYTSDGQGNDILENNIIIPSNLTSSSSPIVIDSSLKYNISRKLFYLKDQITITHEFGDHYKLKLSFVEQASPVYLDGIFIVGVSDVNYLQSC